MRRDHESYWHHSRAFDAMNAHSQSNEPPLTYVMEFNADEREWQQQQHIRSVPEEMEARLRRLR